MDNWRLLNKLRQSVYLGNGLQEYEKDFSRLISSASKSDNMELIKSVLIIKEDADCLNPKQKLLWLTSKICNRFYPPLPVDIAGPFPWNDDLTLLNPHAHYCYEKPVKPDLGVSGPSQCCNLENCSFVASLIGMRTQRVPVPGIKHIEDYLYHVNLHFNGCDHRLVSVDASRIPTDQNGYQLSVTSNDITDKILELAYLQVKAGSYATNGSNTGVDTYILTGCVPEVKSISNITSIQDLISWFTSGNCLLALGTGQHPTELDPPLIRNHDYPVVEVNSQQGIIVLQDPLDPSLRLEMDFKKLLKNYEQLYLNWYTEKLFSYEKTLEFFYNLDKCDRFNTAIKKPLFLLENNSDSTQETWLLLESHLQLEKSIAYLQELPKNFLSLVGPPHEGACDIGLQLLKVEIDPKSSKQIFCHSRTSNAYTIHLYSNTSAVNIGRWTEDKCAKSIECKTLNLEQCYLGTQSYYKNPTFQLEVVHPQTRQFPVNLQLLSESVQDMVNLQIFHLKDHSLQKPIFADPNYTQQRYDKTFISLSTNTPYILVCSSYSSAQEHSYRLQILPSDDHSLLPHIRIKQVFIQFGGLPFQLERKISYSGNQIRIPFYTHTGTICFIRIVPPVLSSLVRMRTAVYNTSGNLLYHKEFSQPLALGGITIEYQKFTGPAQYTLVIDFNCPEIDFYSSYFTLAIGSSKKLTIDEHYC